MPVSAAQAANIMLDAAEERGLALDPLKLQKLLYLTNGYYLALSQEEQPWINEAFEAWKYGPVVPSIYQRFKSFGAKPISTGTRIPIIFSGNKNDPNLKRVLDFVLDRYGSRKGIYLSELTHKVGSPWHETRQENGGDDEISNNLIKQYFSNLVSKPTP